MIIFKCLQTYFLWGGGGVSRFGQIQFETKMINQSFSKITFLNQKKCLPTICSSNTKFDELPIEQNILDTNAGKQLSLAATDV